MPEIAFAILGGVALFVFTGIALSFTYSTIATHPPVEKSVDGRHAMDETAT
jgi:hypothetical protein